ncbi:MAG: WSC domain-containing protein [Dissulfurispiraceae bacterium]
MRLAWKGILVLIVFLFVVTSIGSVFAEMIIITNDGRRYTVPVNKNEVDRIEYTDMHHERSGVRPLGCFRDTEDRDLNGYSINRSDMTSEMCVSICRDRGFEYAGNQDSMWCFCGQRFGKYGPATNCNMPCSGNRGEICGGSWANTIYDIK